MKTSELTGAALDWAVAKCEGIDYVEGDVRFRGAYARKYSTDWAQGGLIIERERLSLYLQGPNCWEATDGDFVFEDSAPLVAAMRCYVASKLGGDIEIPKELT
tara:strand:- start:518 stop:826 length:309 start_codon:yes stop_codon:yes gene_type:complete